MDYAAAHAIYLQQSDQYQCQRHVLGEVGMTTHGEQHVAIATIAGVYLLAASHDPGGGSKCNGEEAQQAGVKGSDLEHCRLLWQVSFVLRTSKPFDVISSSGSARDSTLPLISLYGRVRKVNHLPGTDAVACSDQRVMVNQSSVFGALSVRSSTKRANSALT
jgi:hypothetical protein